MESGALSAWRAQSPDLFGLKLKTAFDVSVVRVDAVTLLQNCQIFQDCWNVLKPGKELPIACCNNPERIVEAVGTWYGQPLSSTSLEASTELLGLANYFRNRKLALQVLNQAIASRQFPMRDLWQVVLPLEHLDCVLWEMFHSVYRMSKNKRHRVGSLQNDPHSDTTSAIQLPLSSSLEHWTGMKAAEVVMLLHEKDRAFPGKVGGQTGTNELINLIS